MRTLERKFFVRGGDLLDRPVFRAGGRYKLVSALWVRPRSQSGYCPAPLMAPGRSTNKHDVALAEVRRKAKRDAILAQGLVMVAVLAASALPLLALRGIVEPLAGRTTKVDVNVVVSIAIALSLALNGFQYLKGLGRKSTIERQRRRLSDLEEALA